MTLDRLMQIAVVQEDVPGTLQGSLFSAANMKYLVIDPTMDYDIPLFEQTHKRASLTKIEGLAGLKMATCRFQLTMHGHGVSTPDLPVYDLLMKACGFKSVITEWAAYNTGTDGPFRHGETVTESTSGTTGIVVHDTYPDDSGNGTIYIRAADGAFTGDPQIITGGTSGATALLDADVEDAGQSWYPVSEQTIRVTHGGSPQPTIGEVITGDTSGAKGIVISNPSTNHTVIRVYNGLMFQAAETVTNVTSGPGFETLSAAVQWDIPSISIGIIEDGVAKRMSGCRGNWSIEANVGEPAVMTFEFSGKAEAPLDQALVAESTITFESKVPPVMLSSALIFGTEGDTVSTADYSPRFSALGFNLNNDVNPRTSANEATGILEYLITGRGATGSFDPEIDLESSYSFIANWRAGTVARCNFQVGTAAGNKFYLSIPGMQTTGGATAERSGVSTRGWEFQATGGHMTNASDTAGSDNDIIITYLLV